MTASRAQLARVALVGVALSLAVFGAAHVDADAPGTPPTNGVFIKSAVAATSPAIAERPSSKQVPLALASITAVLMVTGALAWAVRSRANHRLLPFAVGLTWQRRGPPAPTFS